MLSNLRRIARPGSSLFLISDFRGAAHEHSQEHLFELAKHTELTALACNDPLEFELPRAGCPGRSSSLPACTITVSDVAACGDANGMAAATQSSHGRSTRTDMAPPRKL